MFGPLCLAKFLYDYLVLVIITAKQIPFKDMGEFRLPLEIKISDLVICTGIIALSVPKLLFYALDTKSPFIKRLIEFPLPAHVITGENCPTLIRSGIAAGGTNYPFC